MDTTGVTWYPEPTVYFWLPFTKHVTGKVVMGHASNYFGTEELRRSIGTWWSRYGNAGIIGSSQDSKDPSFAWAPYTPSSRNIVFAHQASDVWGKSSAKKKMTLMFWLASSQTEDRKHTYAVCRPMNGEPWKLHMGMDYENALATYYNTRGTYGDAVLIRDDETC